MSRTVDKSLGYGLYALCLLVGISAISIPLTAAIRAYLPLQVGNRWTLISPAVKTPMIFEVNGTAGAAFTVRWENPWVKNVSYSFRPVGPKVMLAALDLGSGPMQLPEDVVYFNFDPATPQQWSNLLGQFSVIERALKVETPSGNYSDCIHIRYISKEKQASDYYLAPGVGFVQVGEGRTAFRLTAFSNGNGSSGTGQSYTNPSKGVASSTTAKATAANLTSTTGTMVIGLEVNVPGALKQSDYLKWYDKAYRAGSRHIQASPIWSDVEKSPGKYDFSGIDPIFQVAELYSQPVYLNYRVIDTNKLALPAYLNGRSFDDPQVISAFGKMAQAVAGRTKSPGLVKWVSLGNEVDAYLLGHRSSIPAYAKFVTAATGSVRPLFSSAAITVNFTFAGLAELKGALLPLASLCDFYSFTYYPLNADFTFRDPSIISSEINSMVDSAAGRKVFFQELGYASGTRLNSSELVQAQFMDEMFKALLARKQSILGASFVWMSDLDDGTVQQLTSYYSPGNSTNFKEYLATLGLFDRQGNAKQAWAVFEREASKLAAP